MDAGFARWRRRFEGTPGTAFRYSRLSGAGSPTRLEDMAMHGTTGDRRSIRKRLLTAAAVLGSLAALSAACAGPAPAPAPAPPPAEGHVGTRQIAVQLSGATTYSVTANVDSGRLVSRWNGASVATLSGTVGFQGAGGPASATFDLTRVGSAYDGTVSVSDPGAGVAETITHTQVALTFNGDGDANTVAVDGGTQLVWSTDTLQADGLVPALDVLTSQEAEFCVGAQRSLVGVDTVELPTVVNTNHTDRDAFVISKVDYGPLGVHTWTDPDMATTAAGETVAITHRISCKTSSADKLDSLGVSTSPDLECSTLTASSIAAARLQMTPAELAAYDTTGRQVSLQPDVLAPAGPVWLAPFADEVVNGAQLDVTAAALRVDWTDPNYFVLPENFRGVHYCTVWSPAWAYWWMTVGAFIP